jgi:flagellar secretion chaperone FliS
LETNPYASYRSVNVDAQTAQASPVQLVLILMDGLLDELARARAHIEHKRYEAKAASLDKCTRMLSGLSSALEEDAGEVVDNLVRLYAYCAERLFQAGAKLDVSLVDEVVKLLQTLREGWQGLQDRNG